MNDDLAAAIRSAASDADAEATARDSIGSGRVDDVARAAIEGLADAKHGERWLGVLAIVADEVSSTALASEAWTALAIARRDEGRPAAGDDHDASARRSGRRTEAFEAIARAFAFEPERAEPLEVATSIASIALAHESRNALQWLSGLVRDGVLPRNDARRFDAALEAGERAKLAADPMRAPVTRALAGEGTAADFAFLAGDDVSLGSLSIDELEGLRKALAAIERPTLDQAVLLSRLYALQGEGQLAWIVIAKVLKREGDERSAIALMRALESSGDPDAGDYLIPFLETVKNDSDRVRYAIHVAGSFHDHGSDEAKREWVARAANVVGSDRAQRLFEKHFALGSRRGAWLEKGFRIPD